MDKISERVMALSPSATFAMSQKAADLKATGLDVISLSVGEPDFNTPDHIKEAAKKAIDDNFSFYTPVPGYLSLHEAICRKLKRENGLDFTPAQIVVGNGAKQELCDVILSVVNKGEEVLIPVPAWVSYMEMVKIAEGVPVLIYAGPEQKFKVTPQQLEAAITPKTKAVLICSPSNPTGSVYSKEELQGLVDVLARYPDIIVIADEIYAELTYGGLKHTSFAAIDGMRERTILLNGFSKAFAMTGWRMGYVCAPKELIKIMLKVHQYTIMCAATPSQYAAIEALRTGFSTDFADVKRMVETYDMRRRLMVDGLRAAGLSCHEPMGAFYVFPSVAETGLSSQEFCERLLYEKKAAPTGTAWSACPISPPGEHQRGRCRRRRRKKCRSQRRSRTCHRPQR